MKEEETDNEKWEKMNEMKKKGRQKLNKKRWNVQVVDGLWDASL
jgi:hypothetical protein